MFSNDEVDCTDDISNLTSVLGSISTVVADGRDGEELGRGVGEGDGECVLSAEEH